MTLTAEQVAALTERLRAGAPRLLCRWCGSGRVVPADRLLALMVAGRAADSAGVSLLTLACGDCGHVHLFDATLLGLA